MEIGKVETNGFRNAILQSHDCNNVSISGSLIVEESSYDFTFSLKFYIKNHDIVIIDVNAGKSKYSTLLSPR